jgi:hypothetical protein
MAPVPVVAERSLDIPASVVVDGSLDAAGAVADGTAVGVGPGVGTALLDPGSAASAAPEVVAKPSAPANTQTRTVIQKRDRFRVRLLGNQLRITRLTNRYHSTLDTHHRAAEARFGSSHFGHDTIGCEVRPFTKRS